MANQGLEQDFSYLCVQDVRQPPSPKLPPALQPRARGGGGSQSPVTSQNLQPQTYRAVPAVYKPPLRPEDDVLPPPPPIMSGYPDENFPPPPPPPELVRGHAYIDRNDSYPLPPPPTSHDYDPKGPATRNTNYSQQTNYGGTSSPTYDARAILVTAPSGYNRGEGNQSNYVNQTDIRSVAPPPPPPNSMSNYVNVHNNSGAAAAGMNPSVPVNTYTPITPNVTSSQYTSRPVGPSNPGAYGHNVPRSAVFESSAPMPKSDDPGTLTRKSGKEAEVDALTNLLMQNIESAGDPDFFGMCAKCGRKVVGQSNGCTAMDQVFHINCFVCASCGNILRGKSFYAIETKPYCEPCYVNTLEKCSVCSNPVIDRLLRATGKPYHPACFTCVVCGMSLDGVPFTVDATNQIHCIEDFHKKFAPRCCVCQLPIMPDPGKEETVRVVAMDKSFHVQCYCCEDCGLLLSSETEGRGCYPLDDHILCKHCNAKRIQTLTTKMATEL